MRVRVQVFDHDGNGFIDRDELKLTMGRLGEQLSDADVNAMLSLADEDGDGRIDFRVRVLLLSSASAFSLSLSVSRACAPSACRTALRCTALGSFRSMSASCSHSPLRASPLSPLHDVATGTAI